MHHCLEIDCVLRNIISRLCLVNKITLLSINVCWRKVVLVCLRKQRFLATTEYQEGFRPWNACHEHTVSNDNLIKLGYENLDTWNVIASWFPFLESIYFDLCGDEDFDRYSPVFKLLLSTNAKTLKCVSVPKHQLADEETFPMVESLPELKHLIAEETSVKGIHNIIKACPEIEHLRCWSDFNQWHLLPKGIKYLGTPYGKIMGLHNILKSDIVKSLETLEGVLMTPALSSIPFTFACLKRLDVVIEEDTNGCLYNLSRILRNCPVLEIFKIEIFCFDIIDKEFWTSVINECRNVTYFKIYLRSRGEERIEVSLWQDYIAELIESRMKKIEILDLGFALSSKGLQTLEKLEHLKSFRHHLYVKNMVYENIFNADALLRFLSCHFAKNMTKYEMLIPSHYPFGEYLILPELFLSSIETMESELSVKFKTDQSLRHFRKDQPHTEKIPGMIYLTTLSADKVIT